MSAIKLLAEVQDFLYCDLRRTRKLDLKCKCPSCELWCRIDALLLIGGWIPVSERLPEVSSGKVLVTNNIRARDAHGNMSHLWLVNMIHESPWQQYGHYAFDDYDNRVPQQITHWMPLPLPSLPEAK